MQKIILASSLAILLSTVAYSYSISHPNLKQAFDLAEQSIRHVQDAQQANKGIEFGGHAESAIEYLKKAQSELIEGDKYNEAHQKKPK